MRRELINFTDSNMAGQEWTWSFFIERCVDQSFSLFASQDFSDSEDAENALDIGPTTGLRRGADIYQALNAMVEEAGAELGSLDICAITTVLSEFDALLADQFGRGELLLARRAQRKKREAFRSRSAALASFANAIEAYCSKLDDHRPRGGGGVSRPSERVRVKAFLEDFVLTHGVLPKGFHSWRLGNGFLDGAHNFDDLDSDE